jgi:hypothetical protein
MLTSISSSEHIKVVTDNKKVQREEERSEVPLQKQSIIEDKISLRNKSAESITYSISRKTNIAESGFTSLRELIVELLEEQGITTRIAAGDNSIDFKDLTPEQAQELISEEGYLGVEQTSDRIVQFAIAIAGNDPSRLEEIKASIGEGFQQAAQALGGALPDISMKTYDAVMEKLDAWAEDKA